MIAACLICSLISDTTTGAEPADGSVSKNWLGFRGDGTSRAASPAPKKLEVGEGGNLGVTQLARAAHELANVLRPVTVHREIALE